MRRVDDLTYVGQNLPQLNGRVFGGQVLAQGLIAAGRTVPSDRLPHSLHGYFLRAGAVDQPITYAVERLRDGRSFTARRIHALQDDVPILSMILSFQEAQPGLDHAAPQHPVADPDLVDSAVEVLGSLDHPVAQFWTRYAAFDVRHVGSSLYLGPGTGGAWGLEGAGGTDVSDERGPTDRQRVWMRARGVVPESQLVHRALLAYACDQVMLEPVLRRHGLSWATRGLSIASLDHAMWWHRDVRVDDWLLYEQSSPSAQGGRGLGLARVYSRDGTLVATIAQEGMVRAPQG
ncbi:MAG TPA: acyl-CoA thioesterase II [Cellulomonadaceae bacterium]|nr:acyl-CoA thioesterase II [Cellulomonadaceae bacterium]